MRQYIILGFDKNYQIYTQNSPGWFPNSNFHRYTKHFKHDQYYIQTYFESLTSFKPFCKTSLTSIKDQSQGKTKYYWNHIIHWIPIKKKIYPSWIEKKLNLQTLHKIHLKVFMVWKRMNKWTTRLLFWIELNTSCAFKYAISYKRRKFKTNYLKVLNKGTIKIENQNHIIRMYNAD